MTVKFNNKMRNSFAVSYFQFNYGQKKDRLKQMEN